MHHENLEDRAPMPRTHDSVQDRKNLRPPGTLGHERRTLTTKAAMLYRYGECFSELCSRYTELSKIMPGGASARLAWG